MCGTPFWGVAAAIACAYFSYLSYSRLRNGDFTWVHDGWSVLTYGVWIALILGVLSEVRCWRERILFGLVLVNFTLGFTLSAWATAPLAAVREAREISLALWALAAVASLMTLRSPGGVDTAVPKQD
jgi:hypothetical protein